MKSRLIKTTLVSATLALSMGVDARSSCTLYDDDYRNQQILKIYPTDNGMPGSQHIVTTARLNSQFTNLFNAYKKAESARIVAEDTDVSMTLFNGDHFNTVNSFDVAFSGGGALSFHCKAGNTCDINLPSSYDNKAASIICQNDYYRDSIEEAGLGAIQIGMEDIAGAFQSSLLKTLKDTKGWIRRPLPFYYNLRQEAVTNVTIDWLDETQAAKRLFGPDSNIGFWENDDIMHISADFEFKVTFAGPLKRMTLDVFLQPVTDLYTESDNGTKQLQFKLLGDGYILTLHDGVTDVVRNVLIPEIRDAVQDIPEKLRQGIIDEGVVKLRETSDFFFGSQPDEVLIPIVTSIIDGNQRIQFAVMDKNSELSSRTSYYTRFRQESNSTTNKTILQLNSRR